MIITEADNLYSSYKNEPLETKDGEPTILEGETIDIETKTPELQTVSEPEKIVDTGNGIYALKPNVPIKTLDNKQFYIDVEKLLTSYSDVEAEKIVTDLTNNDLSDDILQKLILTGIVSDTQPTKELNKKTLFDNITNFLYNLIYN